MMKSEEGFNIVSLYPRIMMEDLAQNSVRVEDVMKSLEMFINSFRRIAKNPYDILPSSFETSQFPIQWDYNQLYFILLEIVSSTEILPIGIIFTDPNLQFHAIVVIRVYLEQMEKKRGKVEKILQVDYQVIEKSQCATPFVEDLQQKILNHENIHLTVQSYLETTLHYPKISLILIPANWMERVAKAKLPVFNYDALGFLQRFIQYKSRVLASAEVLLSPDEQYLFSFWNFSNLHFQQFIHWIEHWQMSNFEQWAGIIATLLDDMMTNVVFVSTEHQNIILAFKVMVNHRRIMITSLPTKFFKDLVGEELNEAEIAQNLFKKTGVATLILTKEKLEKYFLKALAAPPSLFDLFAYMFEIVYSSTWYPDSLLNAFLKLFGLELGRGIRQFRAAIQVVLDYFTNVLIVTYQQQVLDETKSYEALVHLGVENGKYFIKSLNTAEFRDYFREEVPDKLQRLRNIKAGVESKYQVHFNACFGFNIDLLSEYLSAKNVQALLSMSNIAHQLPFIATLGALFVGMKGMHADQKDQPLIQVAESSKSDISRHPMKMAQYFDGFLKKGILFIADEGQALQKIRGPIHSQNGFLGLDMEVMRELLAKKKKK